jgi:hypothetical protein
MPIDEMMILLKKFDNLARLINYHIGIHEGFELQDVYKLIHQSVFGPEHLGGGVSDHSIAEEMERLTVEAEEPLLEPISLDANACRINLRAIKRLRIPPGQVARPVQESAETFSRDRAELSRLWREVGNSLSALSCRFSNEDFEEMTRLLRKGNYPPMRHSSSYRAHNRPAYRVLLKSQLEIVMPDLSASDLWR